VETPLSPKAQVERSSVAVELLLGHLQYTQQRRWSAKFFFQFVRNKCDCGLIPAEEYREVIQQTPYHNSFLAKSSTLIDVFVVAWCKFHIKKRSLD
jgi:hypothetical protein